MHGGTMSKERNFHGFLLQADEHWADRSVLVLKSEQKSSDGFRRNVTITVHDAKGRNLSQVVQSFRTELVQQRFPDLKLGEQWERTVDQVPAMDLELRHAVPRPDPEEGMRLVPLVRREIIILKEGKAYQIAYADTAESYDEHRAEFEAMIDSLKLPDAS